MARGLFYTAMLAGLLLASSGCARYSLAAYERSIVYQPSSAEAGEWSPPRTIGFEDANFNAADGTRLHGWFLAHPEPRAVVLFMHGNGGNVALWAPSLKFLVDRHRVSALVFDYRGYGKSAGEPSEKGILQDARAARAWLTERTRVNESDVVLMGQSLGGGVAVDLAAKDGARGLVLVSTFTSMPDVAAQHINWLPTQWLMTQRFHSLAKIRSYPGPLLVCHGDADHLIPFEQGEQLYLEAASTQKEFIRHVGGDHNDPPPEEYRLALDRFFDTLPAARSAIAGELPAYQPNVR